MQVAPEFSIRLQDQDYAAENATIAKVTHDTSPLYAEPTGASIEGLMDIDKVSVFDVIVI